MRSRYLLPALVALVLALAAAPAQATTLLPVGSFEEPTYVASDPGNAERLFVVERTGQIVQVQNGAVTPFADLRSVVDCCNGDSGLYSVALAPDFDTSGRFFVDYSGKESPGETHVAEMRASGTSAALSTRRDVLVIPHDKEERENGGQLQFGPEGLLYISTGDGGSDKNDQYHNSQSLTTLLGKILRIDPDPSGVAQYSVPAGNPFGSSNPIWSYGLRNPFRFSFDRLTGAMLIGDVGEHRQEEIDYAGPGIAGSNYGWNCREGTLAGENADDPGCAGSTASSFVEPIFVYNHDPGCAVISGYVNSDPGLVGLYGRYLYGDLCTGEIRSFDLSNPAATDRSEVLHVDALTSFGQDACGRLYAVSGTGKVYRLAGPSASTCGGPALVASIGLRSQARKVKRGSRALLTVFVSPCKNRIGEPVKLLRNGKPYATRHLDRVCTARFRPRITRGARFRATAPEDATYAAAYSRKLQIRVLHAKHKHRRPGK
ncbi:MAG: PQQ-dependent sugar dehydrogenase [Solirubrobacterales bacterium]|nr:PQQ-dependent sugar dehydrogenase [Solirubrobacterales bacterium]